MAAGPCSCQQCNGKKSFVAPDHWGKATGQQGHRVAHAGSCIPRHDLIAETRQLPPQSLCATASSPPSHRVACRRNQIQTRRRPSHKGPGFRRFARNQTDCCLRSHTGYALSMPAGYTRAKQRVQNNASDSERGGGRRTHMHTCTDRQTRTGYLWQWCAPRVSSSPIPCTNVRKRSQLGPLRNRGRLPGKREIGKPVAAPAHTRVLAMPCLRVPKLPRQWQLHDTV